MTIDFRVLFYFALCCCSFTLIYIHSMHLVNPASQYAMEIPGSPKGWSRNPVPGTDDGSTRRERRGNQHSAWRARAQGVTVFSAQRLRDWILLLLCNLIWASQFVLVKIVQEQMGPVAATSFPMLIATILLIPIVHLETRSRGGSSANRAFGKDWLGFLTIGVMGQVVAQLFITWGLRYSLASNGALLMLTLPIVTTVMAYFLLVSFALAAAGVVECSGVDWKELNLTGGTYLLGNALIFISVCGSAFYNVYSKKLLERYTPLQVLLYSYYFVVMFLMPITLYTEPYAFQQIFHYTARTWMGVALLAVLQYCLSMVIFLTVLSRLDATQASLSNYMIPFFGLIIAAIVLHEHLTLFMIVGGTMVLLSTLLITVYEEHRRPKAGDIEA
jgi:drug/metabolite transporter (DMT)-like permease